MEIFRVGVCTHIIMQRISIFYMENIYCYLLNNYSARCSLYINIFEYFEISTCCFRYYAIIYAWRQQNASEFLKRNRRKMRACINIAKKVSINNVVHVKLHDCLAVLYYRIRIPMRNCTSLNSLKGRFKCKVLCDIERF